jgi:hypothetical protein
MPMDTVKFERCGAIAVITLNRSEQGPHCSIAGGVVSQVLAQWRHSRVCRLGLPSTVFGGPPVNLTDPHEGAT